MRRAIETTALFVGLMLIPALWFFLKVFNLVSDRILPSPQMVVIACRDIEPNILLHCASTLSRLAVGFLAGTLLGIALGIALNCSRIVSRLLLPSFQALRAVPAAATVFFFLLWFGFSETGRLLLVVLTVSTNVAIASQQILVQVPERYAVFFHSFGINQQRLVWSYSVPMIVSQVLPTLRFSLALVIGAQIVSEFLGAQLGLGYVIQNARSTFAMPALFLAIILLGAMTALCDSLLCRLWRTLVYWRKDAKHGFSKQESP